MAAESPGKQADKWNGSLQKMQYIRLRGARGYGERWGKMGKTDRDLKEKEGFL